MPTKNKEIQNTGAKNSMPPLRMSSGCVRAMPQNLKLLQRVFSFWEVFPSSSQVPKKANRTEYTSPPTKYLANNQKPWIPLLKDGNSYTSQLHSSDSQEIAQSLTLQIRGIPVMPQGWHRAINQQPDIPTTAVGALSEQQQNKGVLTYEFPGCWLKSHRQRFSHFPPAIAVQILK